MSLEPVDDVPMYPDEENDSEDKKKKKKKVKSPKQRKFSIKRRE